MPEVPIPGMAFRARLSKKGDSNVVELIFRGKAETSNNVGEKVTETAILGALKQGCTEAEIDHQVPEAILLKVARDLFKEAGLGEGKALVPQEFELDDGSSEIDRKLAIIISSLQKLQKKIDRIESLIKFGTEPKNSE